MSFTSVDLDGAAGSGLNIAGNTNAITVSAGSIGSSNDPGGNAVDIAGGSANISIAASVTKNTGGGDVVEITGRTGGTVDFSGAISASGGAGGIDIDANTGGTINFTGQTTLSTGAGNGVDITGSAGATINFNAGGNGLDITTTTGVGFNATGAGPAATSGGTVNVQGSGNTINSTGGTALNVVNTTIGANNLTFQSISANGGSNGIVLNNTGTSGHLTVTGTGTTAGSGGTIQNTTGDGVKLTDTQDVSLSNMTISDNAGSGINGLRVNGVTLTKLTLNSNADTQAEAGILFNELTGNASHVTTFSNLTVSNSFTHNFQVINSGGTLTNLVVSGSTFSNDGASANAGSDFIFESDTAGVAGTPTMTLTANSNTFTGNNAYPGPGVIPGTGLFIVSNDGTVNAHIGEGGGNTFNNLNNGINLTQSSNAANGTGGNLNFTVKNNTVTNSISTAVNVFSAGDLARTLDGIIQSNVIGIQGVATSGSKTGIGIRIGHESLGVAKVLIDSNTVQSISVAGVSGGDSITVTQLVQPGTVHATITNNIIRDNADNAAIVFNDAKAGATINADVHGNTISNVVGTPIKFFADGIGANDGVINVPQASGAAITGVNGGAAVFTSAGVLFNKPVPLAPSPTPLLAALGGVASAAATPGETHLTQAQLDSVVAAAIAQWAHAGATPAQLAALAAISFSVADLGGNTIGEQAPGHIVIDADAAGHGWFVDSTPSDNSEFTHAQNAAGTDLFTDPANAAAGHLDLLTAVVHEMGHELGLPDLTAAADAHELMYINLVDGERRLPDAGEVAVVNTTPPTPVIAHGPLVMGTPGNDTVNAGPGGNTLVGLAGADQFVFTSPPVASAPLTHVADYHFAEGDTFDFSALTSALNFKSADDSFVVRAVEDAGGTFATLQVNASGPSQKTPSWVDVAQLDGARAGDDVSVLIDSNGAAHLAHLHVGLLV